MFMELYKFSKLVMHLNSCSMDLGSDINDIALHEKKDQPCCYLQHIDGNLYVKVGPGNDCYPKRID